MPLSAGDKLGPYEILSAIGAGGMGEVYRRDTRLDSSVAVALLVNYDFVSWLTGRCQNKNCYKKYGFLATNSPRQRPGNTLPTREWVLRVK